MIRFNSAVVVCTLLLSACGSGGSEPTADNAGSISLGTNNTTIDSGPISTGGTEESTVTGTDFGTTDGGTGADDAGSTDGGTGDAGSTDSGVSSGDDASGIPVSGDLPASTDGSVADAELASSPTALPEPERDITAGTLTAADYDDNLNPGLYHRYASNYLQNGGNSIDIPFLDMTSRISITVFDQNGKHYEGAQIQLSNANENILTRTSNASGMVHLFAGLDELPDTFEVRVTGLFGNEISDTFSRSDAVESGSINVTLPEVRFANGATVLDKPIDLLFAIDTTGSMGDELDYLKDELQSIISEAFEDQRANFNIALLLYRDDGDDYVVHTHNFTNDLAQVQRDLDGESYGGGGDYPEAMDQAMQRALTLNWQQDSHKIMFLIADAPPHANKMRATWNAAREAQQRNIHVVPVAASGVAEDAEYIMRNMAALTGSRYVFLTDDSGVGNPHAEPDVDCYVVTQLNRLMARIVVHLVSGERLEPTDNEIIRRVGNYNNGKCEVDVQQQ